MDVSNRCRKDGNQGSKTGPKRGWVYPSKAGAATEARSCFGLEKGGSRAYLWGMTVHFPFQNSYAALPANFFVRVAPTPVASPRLIKLNRPLAEQLGLDADLLDSPE